MVFSTLDANGFSVIGTFFLVFMTKIVQYDEQNISYPVTRYEMFYHVFRLSCESSDFQNIFCISRYIPLCLRFVLLVKVSITTPCFSSSLSYAYSIFKFSVAADFFFYVAVFNYHTVTFPPTPSQCDRL